MSSTTSRVLFKRQFVTSPNDSLQCPVCLEVATDPWQHDKCGKLFCRECLEKHGKKKSCPHCREEQPQYFEDTKSNREIKELRVKCSNYSADRACEWEDTLDLLENHMTECDFALVPCTNRCKNADNTVQQVMRKELAEHLTNCANRLYNCNHCGKNGRFSDITEVHDKQCPEKVVSCTNAECAETTERRGMKRHLQECPFTEVPCKFIALGCEMKKKRSEMKTHEKNDRQHLPIALGALAKLQEEKAALQDKVTRLENTTKLTTTFKVTDYEEKRCNDEELESAPFYSNPGGYRMAISMRFGVEDGDDDEADNEVQHISVYPIIKAAPRNGNMKQWPFKGEVTITLLNHLENKNHFSKTIQLTLYDKDIHLKSSTRQGCRNFILDSELAHDPVKNTQYLKDDTLYFKVEVEVADHKPWLECTQVHDMTLHGVTPSLPLSSFPPIQLGLQVHPRPIGVQNADAAGFRPRRIN